MHYERESLPAAYAVKENVILLVSKNLLQAENSATRQRMPSI